MEYFNKVMNSAARELHLLQELLTNDKKKRSQASSVLKRNCGVTQEQKNGNSETFPEEQVKVLLKENKTLVQSLNKLKDEKRDVHELQVHLEAVREALFIHQRKTTDHIEDMEEKALEYQERCRLAEDREKDALERIQSLEKALEEMQVHKNIIQKQHSESLDELCKLDQEKSNHVAQAKRELQRSLEQLAQDLEQKEEENIRLQMTLLKIQEDLSRENRRKDDVIEERDLRIQEIEAALSELRLHSSQMEMEVSVDKEEIRAKQLIKDEVQDEVESRLTSLQIKMDRQEAELSLLRRENEELKETLRKCESHRSKVNGLVVFTQREGKLEGENSEEFSRQVPDDEDVEESSAIHMRLSEVEEKAKNAQDRADHMTLLLNQKLIELNKLQLTLSNQTKDMIQLEKAYFQLRCHLGKNYRSPASSSRSSRIDLVS